MSFQLLCLDRRRIRAGLLEWERLKLYSVAEACSLIHLRLENDDALVEEQP